MPGTGPSMTEWAGADNLVQTGMMGYSLVVMTKERICQAVGGELQEGWSSPGMTGDEIHLGLEEKFMIRSLARRQVLSGIGSTLFLPFFPKQGFASDVDVVIVGAGSAGIAAARIFSEKGIKFKLLEAKDRIGGRAFTDNETFGKPFDLGCTFQHQSELNPYVGYARKYMFEIGNLPPDEKLLIWIGQGEATGRQYKQISRRWEAYKEAFTAAGRSGLDISAAEAVSELPKTQYDKMVMHWLLSGSEPGDTSILQWWNEADGTDMFSPAGYGNIVSHFGRNLEVSLEMEVKEVDWSGSGVTVITNKGTIKTKHCIVTVSNGVLASGAIKFTPQLVKRQEVVAGIPMVNYTTVGLKFSRRNVLPTIRNAWFSTINNQNDSMEWMDDIGRSGVVRANIHGDMAAQIEAEGEKATVAFALAELKKILGSKGVPKLKRAVASRWSRDRHVLGAWSVAKPGFGSKRAYLRNIIGERLHFAGEASHRNMYTTCHGARLSGEEAARKIVRKIG